MGSYERRYGSVAALSRACSGKLSAHPWLLPVGRLLGPNRGANTRGVTLSPGERPLLALLY
jgi:hypothetical protein